MRITNRYMANNVLNAIQSNLSKLARSQEQISTSRRLLRPSDDPNVMGQFLAIKSTLSYNEQYSRNIDDGLGYLNMNDAAMGTLGEILSKAKEYTVQAANDTYNAEDRIAVAEQIDKMIDQVVDLGNSTVGGKYIYAGAQNSSPPFERDGDRIIYHGDYSAIYREVMAGTDYRIDAPGVTTGAQVEAVNNEAKESVILPVVNARQDDREKAGVLKLTVTEGGVTCKGYELDGITEDPDLITGADYNFDPDTKVFEVTGGSLEGLKITFPASNPGAEYKLTLDSRLGVFGNADLTTIVYDQETGAPESTVVYDPANARTKADADKGIFDVLFALRDRLKADDSEGLQASIGELQEKIDLLLQHRVQVGARMSHFESIRTQLLDIEVKLTSSLETIEGADMARLSIEVSQQELSYNASLAVGANIMRTSLLNFLR